MTEDPNREAVEDGGKSQEEAGAKLSATTLGRFPGLAAIALYMLLLAGIVILGVVMKFFPPLYLAFSALFISAGMGLLLMFRWAWALTMAAVLLLAAMFFYQFATLHTGSGLVQGLLNLIFFFYLVRAEVREALR